jgi:hypothetical protein
VAGKNNSEFIIQNSELTEAVPKKPRAVYKEQPAVLEKKAMKNPSAAQQTG